MDIFDILGPIMIGPSSSHTAGAARIGGMARTLLGEEVAEARIFLHGSFAETGAGHGTDRAVVGGLLGMKPDDLRIPDAFDEARRAGMIFSIEPITLKNAHPNTVLLELTGRSGKTLSLQCSSLGGGRIRADRLNGIEVSFTGAFHTLVIRNADKPGLVALVTQVLDAFDINLANMSLSRSRRGADALMVIEADQPISPAVVAALTHLPDVLSVIYYDKGGDDDGPARDL